MLKELMGLIFFSFLFIVFIYIPILGIKETIKDKDKTILETLFDIFTIIIWWVIGWFVSSYFFDLFFK